MAQRGEGREEIVRAATTEFAANGFVGTSTAAIARRAGVSQPALYHHFDSKDALWRACFDRVFAQLSEQLQQARELDQQASLEEQLRSMLRAFVRYAGHNQELNRMMAYEMFASSDRFRYAYDEHIAPLMGGVRALIGAAQEQGVLDPSIDLTLLRGILVGSGVYFFMADEGSRLLDNIDPGDPEVIERYAELVTRVIFDGVRSKP